MAGCTKGQPSRPLHQNIGIAPWTKGLVAGSAAEEMKKTRSPPQFLTPFAPFYTLQTIPEKEVYVVEDQRQFKFNLVQRQINGWLVGWFVGSLGARKNKKKKKSGWLNKRLEGAELKKGKNGRSVDGRKKIDW